jgi:SagB-type dehydrogenase family enzyme
MPGGFYYYHPVQHRLLHLSAAMVPATIYEPIINRPIFDTSAFALFLVARLSAIEPMYGPPSRDFCLLEAGYMSQLLMLVAQDHELGTCAIGGVDFAQIRPHFGLSEQDELVHSLLGGRSEPGQQQVRVDAAAMNLMPPPSGTSESDEYEEGEL